MIVHTHFTKGDDGPYYAREIASKYIVEDEGEDSDGDGSFDGAEGHALGTLDSMPDDGVQVWVIGGIDYVVTDDTKFEEEDGPLEVGANIRVEYIVDGSNTRIAHKIETTTDTGGVGSSQHQKVYGFVQHMSLEAPPINWTIDGIAFQVDERTKYEEELGLLVEGSYVAVEYSVQGGVNLIREIESHVPPGAGKHEHIGRVESMDEDGMISSAANGADRIWVIAGVRYLVTPATNFNEVNGDLAVGAPASVNSYTAADGSEVATQIRGIAMNYQLHYLPQIRK